jgi:hypothetical protein
LEQFSSARHHLGFYNNVGISAAYACSALRSADLKAKVFSGLAIVIERHPALSAIVVDEDSNDPYFARLPEINLEQAVTFMARRLPVTINDRDVELDSILETQHNQSFKDNYGSLPFWRLIIVTASQAENEFVASFIFHHALGDGGSGMGFHRDFLEALSLGQPPLKSNVIRSPNTPLLPSLETLLPLAEPPASVPHTLGALWSGSKVIPPTRSNFYCLALSPTTTEYLLQACKFHGTTLTSTLAVLISLAIFSTVPPNFDTLECTIPVSLHRWLPEPIDENVIGVFIDAFQVYYNRESLSSSDCQFLWTEARRSRSLFTDYLKSNGKKINVAKFKQIEDMRRFFLGKVGKERRSAFDVSNLGVMKAERKGEWGMGRVLFSRSAFVSGSAISVGIVTGADGCLTLGFCWQEGVVERDVVEMVIEKVRVGIERIADKMEVGHE